MAKLRVAEVFSSIQGEGEHMGVPSVFVRVSGCNLRCVWCDTPYASWAPEGEFWEVDDLVKEVHGLGVVHVVVTGGEPMLFEPVERLCSELENLGHSITIETAGTVFRKLRCHLMSISPKLANSAPGAETGWRERHEATRTNLPVLHQLVDGYHSQLKFVVGSTSIQADVQEIKELLSKLPTICPQRVLLMPEGIDSESLRSSQNAVVEVCMREGWRYCPRLHIELFGNRRGT